MLIVSIVVSVITLVAINCLVRRGWFKLPVLICIVPSVVSMPLMYQTFFTLPLFLILESPTSYRRFAIASSAVAFLAYAIPFAIEVNRIDNLQAKYPFQSIEDRIPPAPVSRTEYDQAEINKLEDEIDGESKNTTRMKMLHEDHVSHFTRAIGFGRGRMLIFKPTDKNLEERNAPGPISQPAQLVRSEGDPGEPYTPRSKENLLPRLHLIGVVDFVNPGGFGYARSRREVAGFRPHRFSAVPKMGTEWAVNSIELLGVLMHDTPQVYVSKNLPRMDELAKGPTRPLDAFESQGLAALKSGEELHVRSVHDGARMLGAIRNAKQCTTCHGGQRGDLLGAFTYHLRKTE